MCHVIGRAKTQEMVIADEFGLDHHGGPFVQLRPGPYIGLILDPTLTEYSPPRFSRKRIVCPPPIDDASTSEVMTGTNRSGPVLSSGRARMVPGE